MQIKEKYDRLLYYTWYIGSFEVSRIQTDPGFTLSIMLCKVMHHLGIPTHQLSTTQIIIYGINANGTCPIGKIKFKCQICDLKFEVTCYVIDADTSYNLLLGRSWIHGNPIVPSTFHQVTKYADEGGEVRMLIVEKHPFKGVDNYFTDSLLYQDSLETVEDPSQEDPDSSNVVDTEPEPEEKCL